MPPRHHILVVDDEPIHRDSLAELLLTEGYGVTTCDSAIDAWEKLRGRHRIDLVVCDVLMPQVNGIQFAQWVLGSSQPVPIVLVTGHDGVLDSILAAGAVALIKPYSITALKFILEEQLTGMR